MGQTQSGLHYSSTGVVIEYVSCHEATRGTHITHHVGFNQINILKQIREELGPKIKAPRISLVIRVGPGFVDDDIIAQVHLSNLDIKNAWKGFTVEGIRVEGAFSHYSSQVAATDWWDGVQKLVTHVGLTVEPDVGLVNLTSLKSNTGLPRTGPIDTQYLVTREDKK